MMTQRALASGKAIEAEAASATAKLLEAVRVPTILDQFDEIDDDTDWWALKSFTSD